MRNWKPFIPDVVKKIAADGVTHVVAICLAPQNSRTSVGLYRKAVDGPEASTIRSRFRGVVARSSAAHRSLRREAAMRDGTEASVEAGAKLPVIFTAHSVPERTIAEGDPYEAQTRETAELVAREAELPPEEWKFAFQSQGMSGGTWLGPTVEETILDLKAQGHTGVFVQPIGFLCDHVEVLYDIDIGFQEFAKKHGMRLWRAESLNESPKLIAALADLVSTRLKK